MKALYVEIQLQTGYALAQDQKAFVAMSLYMIFTLKHTFLVQTVHRVRQAAL